MSFLFDLICDQVLPVRKIKDVCVSYLLRDVRVLASFKECFMSL